MKKILFINACLRPESRTRKLAQSALESLDGEITELRLFDEPPKLLDMETMSARDEALSSGDFSAEVFSRAREFAGADEIVIAAPYWDLLFPAVVRLYLESVTVTGLTFRYSPEGIPIGMCNAKRLIYVTTAGGPIGENNFGFEYVKALARNFYGIKDVQCFSAEGLDIYGADTGAIMDKAVQKVKSQLN